MDFFPSESQSHKSAASAPVAADPAAEIWLQPPVTTEVPRVNPVNPDVTQLNVTVTQAMKEVQGLWAELGQLRTMASDLAENYSTLLQTYSAADRHRQDLEAAFARIDSLAQIRLTELGNASDLGIRTEQMLARVEGFSAETDRQLAAIADARNLFSRELAQAKAGTLARADTPDALPAPVDRLDAYRVRLTTAIAAIQEKTARTSRRAIVAVALAVLAVVAIAATWPDGKANEMEVPVIESRAVGTFGLQPPELPQRLAPTTPAVPQPPAAVRSSRSRVANPSPAPGAVFMGQLAIESSPPGATVFIDGKPAGETPVSSVRVRAGSHAVWVELPNYRRWTAAVQVPGGRLTRINATLRRP
jgi:hypothetical protein